MINTVENLYYRASLRSADQVRATPELLRRVVPWLDVQTAAAACDPAWRRSYAYLAFEAPPIVVAGATHLVAVDREAGLLLVDPPALPGRRSKIKRFPMPPAYAPPWADGLAAPPAFVVWWATRAWDVAAGLHVDPEALLAGNFERIGGDLSGHITVGPVLGPLLGSELLLDCETRLDVPCCPGCGGWLVADGCVACDRAPDDLHTPVVPLPRAAYQVLYDNSVARQSWRPPELTKALTVRAGRRLADRAVAEMRDGLDRVLAGEPAPVVEAARRFLPTLAVRDVKAVRYGGPTPRLWRNLKD